MSNIISGADVVRHFRCIYVPRGAQSMRMYGAGRLAQFIGQLESNQQNAYGMIRFYTDTNDPHVEYSPESQAAGGHYVTVEQGEGLIAELAFTFRRFWNNERSHVQLMAYNLSNNDGNGLALGQNFLADFVAVSQNMGLPINIRPLLYSNFINEFYSEEVDLDDFGGGPAHQSAGIIYYEGRESPLPVGISYSDLADSVYGVWLWALWDMRAVDMALSYFTTPPDFPLMPSYFIGGEPMMGLPDFNLLSYQDVPVSLVVAPSMVLGVREGGEEYGRVDNTYFLTGNVPTAYSDEEYDDLRSALDAQFQGRALTDYQRAVVSYASSVNNFNV